MGKLIKNDPSFPIPIKEGRTRQAAVYFDTKQIEYWWQLKVEEVKLSNKI
ncbi:hypothetical protein ACINNAV21_1094 [Acinetobacter baumannii Naval-21]|uniref:Uncharacterized protein n=1 Tax=Acinetobacter baumannii MRSN 3527 TaxID=1409923 RepID=A0A0J0ZPZ9_ACIBA|nr:hypothetical protein AN415_01225 [Acinetobacter baumannii]EKL42417.1 hypothetical protein ACIN5074_1171 [Acinetobacter baumannii OIFC074]EKP55267.1 hypothetical protein ACINNAV21_1094 [Acinetobacter baumannii Naval-21]KLT82400.1 hypothetical protein T632_2709 [Acinetobacter baumannii MRSN 4106]KLT84356.1 hypothetical protein T630_2893 [Acinetobacter baumannii MRSN 3527]KLT97246.1 hypothetical protein T629_2848 [Acinetobacter baumannii MRSN 3405]KLU00088.1 hypothetical protein T631_2782 [Ac